MTTYNKAAQIIAETLPKCRGEELLHAADRILRALLEKRIMPTTIACSPDLLTRFHAHARWLGEHTKYGYRYFYDMALDAMVAEDDWPVKVVAKTITIDGHDITVDMQIAESTTKACNRQMLGAYTIITDAAKEHGVSLPERFDNTDGV